MFKLEKLPLKSDVESRRVLKSLPPAHKALAELRGVADSIPDQNILLNTLSLQEAKDSSEIENIITTYDELYKSEINKSFNLTSESKEVQNYVSAMKRGLELIQRNGFLSNRIIIEIQAELEKNIAGFRKLPGTVLKNEKTGEVVYEPPQTFEMISDLMDNLEEYINDKTICEYDVLVKMAVIHYQFESIHPFYDGNGRAGRIINILYLILNDLQSLPILYMSKNIIRQKMKYYQLLQEVRDTNNWEEWLLYIIDIVEKTAIETTELIKNIKLAMSNMKHEIRGNYKFYSHELINNLFKHPYTKVEFIIDDLNVSKNTATSYLKKLADDGLLKKEKIGYQTYYVNERLYELLDKRR